MERRYALMNSQRCPCISDYKNSEPVRNGRLERFPHIMIVVDELVDLMRSPFKREIEETISQLAAKARAAGIHLIVATQRPSTDIITGTIKSNLTSRIAFRMSSQIDSRVLLDCMGAEALSCNGDMLYFPFTAAYPTRVQSCYVSYKDVMSVVKFLTDNSSAEADAAASAFVFDNGGDTKESEEFTDPLIPNILYYAIKQNGISVAAVQRRFSVGFARAAHIIDMLEELGYISPSSGNSKPREIWITLEEFREKFGNLDD